jgi:hypothetical protein
MFCVKNSYNVIRKRINEDKNLYKIPLYLKDYMYKKISTLKKNFVKFLLPKVVKFVKNISDVFLKKNKITRSFIYNNLMLSMKCNFQMDKNFQCLLCRARSNLFLNNNTNGLSDWSMLLKINPNYIKGWYRKSFGFTFNMDLLSLFNNNLKFFSIDQKNHSSITFYLFKNFSKFIVNSHNDKLSFLISQKRDTTEKMEKFKYIKIFIKKIFLASLFGNSLYNRFEHVIKWKLKKAKSSFMKNFYFSEPSRLSIVLTKVFFFFYSTTFSFLYEKLLHVNTEKKTIRNLQSRNIIFEFSIYVFYLQ